MMNRRVFAFIVTASSMVVFIGCGGSGAGSSSNNPPSNSINASKGDGASANTSSAPATARDLEPVEDTVLNFVDNTKDNDYRERHMGAMVNAKYGELWEVGPYQVRVGVMYGSESIICRGNFAEYAEYADKVKAARDAKRSPKASIKGVFKGMDGTSPLLDPCVLTDLDKP